LISPYTHRNALASTISVPVVLDISWSVRSRRRNWVRIESYRWWTNLNEDVQLDTQIVFPRNCSFAAHVSTVPWVQKLNNCPGVVGNDETVVTPLLGVHLVLHRAFLYSRRHRHRVAQSFPLHQRLRSCDRSLCYACSEDIWKVAWRGVASHKISHCGPPSGPQWSTP
jgi:hypothetical protein